MLTRAFVVLGVLIASVPAAAQWPDAWHEAQKPFRVYGNTYYVGTRGLSSILITSRKGHVLIDGTLPEGAALVAANVEALGFRVKDIKLILNTHAHFDHAGGIGQLQQLSGATVAASAESAKVLSSGVLDRDDPQYNRLPAIAIVSKLKQFNDGEVLKVGPLDLTAHLTPGHTPGGTSWSWQSCEAHHCLELVYADSLNPISAEGYRFTDPNRKPNGAAQLEHSFALLNTLPCDILLTPHPELADLFGKLARREQDATQTPFVDAGACRTYVRTSRAKLDLRIAEERAK